MIQHLFDCGCEMYEGHPKSTHATGDFRTVSCVEHQQYASHVWPHLVKTNPGNRIPDAVDAFVAETLTNFVSAHAAKYRS